MAAAAPTTAAATAAAAVTMAAAAAGCSRCDMSRATGMSFVLLFLFFPFI